ncbi:hypothetical protein [Brachybacterium sp. GPGPB12]|uniref:hypothetical protein n=1 Tax=Brachybacterium sp. GPGPB12 TaxID=3023517 RepID=UPI0031343C51
MRPAAISCSSTSPPASAPCRSRPTTRRSTPPPPSLPDGTRLALLRSTLSTPTDTSYDRLEIHTLAVAGRDGGDHAGGGIVSTGHVTAELGDLTLTDLEWSDAATLLVAGDLHSSGAVLTVDATTGSALTLADGGVFSSLSPAPRGDRAGGGGGELAGAVHARAATSAPRRGRCGSRPTARSRSRPPRARSAARPAPSSG